MRRILCFSALFLAACAREPVEKPIVDLTTLGGPHHPIPAPKFAPGNAFKRLYAAPASAADREAWLARLNAARELDRRTLREEAADLPGAVPSEVSWPSLKTQVTTLPSLISRPELAWEQTNFIETPLPFHDRHFYDPGIRRYTVGRWLDEEGYRYGGPDAVVLEHAYPNLGIDERNQFDFFRDLPGGVDALKRAMGAFHSRGVKVLLAYHGWDTGTRAEPGGEPASAAKLVKEIGADGVFADTEVAPPISLFRAGEELGRPFAIEPEAGFGDSLEGLLWTPATAADWRPYTAAPGVDRYRWVEPRIETHVGARDESDRLDALQYAWLNGAGVMAWENVAGIWNGLSQRDGEILRRISLVYHAIPEFPRSPGWEPYSPNLQTKDVYTSRWPLPFSGTVWTVVNRGDDVKRGPLLEVEYFLGQRFYDLWTGEEIHPAEKLINRAVHHAVVELELEPHGFGGVVETNEPPRIGSNLAVLLAKLRERHRAVPFVNSLSPDRVFASQTSVDIKPTPRFAVAPAGMVKIPGVKHWRFAVTGTETEGFAGGDVQYPWETHPRRDHEAYRDIAPFYLDRLPVTNLQFKKFLDARDFQPADPHGFLRDWPEGKVTARNAQRPVTWVAFEEARMYCRALGKRLPHEWEWQYAAQGTDARPYPWGKEWDQNRVPVPDEHRERRPPPDVGSFEAGASPFGVLDMVGLVWQWTDEFFDEHTRSAILKGGSYYMPAGSPLYLNGTAEEGDNPAARGHYRVDQHAKYLLMDPTIDRAGTIGFRCAVDASE
jgi:iron(II)-dependent oxidoreductase